MGLLSKFAKSRSSGPARPYPKSFAGWKASSTSVTVADLMEFQAEFEALLAERSLDNINGAEFDDRAYLVRERSNPDDYVAVCTWIQGYFTGRLDQATTGKYVVEMNGLDSQRLNLAVPAYPWVQRTKTRLANRVILGLPSVGAVGPVSFLPKQASAILSPGDEIVLENLENYVGPLCPFISTGKTVSMVLTMVEEQSNLHAYSDKKTYAGRVPDMQAELIIPLVRATVSHRLIPVVCGLPTGSGIRNGLSTVTGNTRTVGTNWVPTHDGGR